jgi:hypothetical protein
VSNSQQPDASCSREPLPVDPDRRAPALAVDVDQIEFGIAIRIVVSGLVAGTKPDTI